MPKKLNFAVAGRGRVSYKHIDAIARIKQAHLYAVCDRSIDRAAAPAPESPRVYGDYGQLLKDKNIDVINICTPSGAHAEMAIAAAKYKKHVILEKPMALSVADGQSIVKAFERSKTSLAVVMQNRCNTPVEFLKKHATELGKLLNISANAYWYKPQAYYEDRWHGRMSMDGGALMNQGTHYVDMVLYLAGKKVKKVSAFGGTYRHKMECEDAISVNLLFDDGTVANVQANTIAYPENYEGTVTLFYEHATVRIGGIAMDQITYWRGKKEKQAAALVCPPVENIYGNGHYNIIKNMADHLLKGQPLLVTGKDGLASLAIIEAAYKSIVSHQTVNIH
jgi:UDP-N-acetyl-2-amino-2-deoxyglucuronate dehydrogenase